MLLYFRFLVYYKYLLLPSIWSDRVVVLTQRPATVEKIHTIDFEMENRTPLNCRENPKFSKYFNLMWKELEKDEEAKRKK